MCVPSLERRAVADIGTHWLDLVQFVSGHRITAVCADLQTVHPRRRRPQGLAQQRVQRQPPQRQQLSPPQVQLQLKPRCLPKWPEGLQY